jgi:hypothetical protein
MIRYTVTYTRRALDALARVWMNAPDRQAITNAGDEIDQDLCIDAPQQGVAVAFRLRQLIVTPLVVEFIVEEEDRKATVLSVRHIGELTNGH